MSNVYQILKRGALSAVGVTVLAFSITSCGGKPGLPNKRSKPSVQAPTEVIPDDQTELPPPKADDPETPEVESVVFTKLSALADNFCALTDAKKIYCWGNNNYGQLGIGAKGTNVDKPTLVDTSKLAAAPQFTDLCVGGIFSLGLGDDGKLYSWGDDTFGSLGDGAAISTTTRVVAIDNSDAPFTQLTCGMRHACAINNGGKIFCWGWGKYGMLGNGSTDNKTVPTAINDSDVAGDKTFISVAAFGFGTCAITTANKGYCWGDSENGLLGREEGSVTNGLVPNAWNDALLDPAQAKFKEVRGGSMFNCALNDTGRVYCWGVAEYGQLGNDQASVNSYAPTEISLLGIANAATDTGKFLAVGSNNACVITQDNILYCWGKNDFGQLGDNTTVQSNKPVAVDLQLVGADKKPVDVAIGKNSACLLTNLGSIHCWGDSTNGSLGNGAPYTNLLRPGAEGLAVN